LSGIAGLSTVTTGLFVKWSLPVLRLKKPFGSAKSFGTKASKWLWFSGTKFLKNLESKMNSPMSAEQHREKASLARKAEDESWERSDTDGCVSQWCSNLSAQKHMRQAEIIDAGGVAEFLGLYHEGRRVAARLVSRQCFNQPWAWESVWELNWAEEKIFGRRFVPLNWKKTSRIHKQLGLSELGEMAPAEAAIAGSGTGLSGLASCYVRAERIGDQWGQDAILIK
jgi:hypothetical protein